MLTRTTHGAGRLARSCQSVSRMGGRGFDPVQAQNFYKTNNQPQGAMWQPMTGPRGTSTTNQNMPTCRSLIGPRACHLSNCHRHCPVILPRQLLTSSVPRVTLTVVTCVTPGLVQLSALYIQIMPATCHLLELPHVSPLGLPRHLYGPYGLYSHHATWHCTDCTVIIPLIFFFACLPFRTERDIFCIRSPFDEVNIPPESGR
jgi:hypothetical protein